MFHRIKSEVQETEQRIQPRQKVELDYRQEESRATISAAREVREQASEVPSRDETMVRPYTQQPEAKEQEEVRIMNRQPQEDKEVQGKYSREQEAIGTRARSSDVVSSASAVPSYQRPAATTAAPAPQISRPSSFSSSYAPTPYSSAASSSESLASSGDRSLTIGRGINMSGEIEACEHLIVEGTVEAALKGAKVLDVAESGTFYGTVEIEEATVAGRFEGDLTVNGRLTIRSSGVITGSVAYRELEVEAGAVIDGRMTPLKGTVDPKSADRYRAGSDASAMAKAKDLLSKKDNREPANAESALFSKAHASY